MKLLEAVMFCCLSALALFWFADRLRGLDFDPITVMPCVGAECSAYVGPERGSPLNAFTEALDARGVTSFSRTNICTQLADTLQTRGEDGDGVAEILQRITARGTVTVTRPDEGMILISPGARNDSFDDAIRDAFRLRPARGCNPINYKPVFWPLWSGWLLLFCLGVLRGRQAEWAKR